MSRPQLPALGPGAAAAAAGVAACTLLATVLAMLWHATPAMLAGLAAAGAVMASLFLFARFIPVPVLALAYVAVLAAWILGMVSQQVSDFGVYFRCGAADLHPWGSFSEWAARCKSAWLPGFGTYWRRSLLYSLPLGWLTGGSYAGLKLANALLHVLAVVLLYRGARTAFGKPAALAAAALLAVYPEFWFVTTLAASDNLVVPGIVALLLLLERAPREQSSWPWIAQVAVLVVALDLLRSVGPILLLAVAWLAAIRPRGERFPLLAAVAMGAVGLLLVHLLSTHAGLDTRQHDGLLTSFLNNGLARPTGFDTAYSWHHYVLQILPAKDRAPLTAGFIAQELHHAAWLPGRWLDKSLDLLAGDGYYFFAHAGPLSNPDDLVMPGARTILSFSATGMQLLRGVMAAFCLAALAGLVRSIRHPLVQACAALLATFLLLIVVMGESQSRYSVIVAPAFCLCAASLLAPRGPGFGGNLKSVALGAASVGTLALAGVLAASVAARAYAARAPQLTWSAQPAAACPAASAWSLEPNRLVLDLARAPCQGLQAVPERFTDTLVLHVLRTPIPPKWNHGPFAPVRIEVIVHRQDGRAETIRQVLQASAAVGALRIPAAGVRSVELAVRADPGTPGGVALAFGHEDLLAVGHRTAAPAPVGR